MTQSFDQWLGRELSQSLAPIVGEPAQPGQARYQALAMARGASHRVSRKVLVAAAVATMALAGGTAAAAGISGSLDPRVWGQQVKSAVDECNRDLQPGQHGIGACVSAFARHHDEQMGTPQPSASGAAPGKNHAGPPWLRQETSPTPTP